jgi:subfamily B ATP-binding cassette protein MsbA
MVIIFLVALLSISLKLTLITIVILPVSGFLIARIGSSIKRNSTKAQHVLGRMSSIFEESIGGLRIIKGYNAIDYANDKFQKENFYHYRLYKKIFRINELASPMVEILSILSIVVVMIFAGNMILETGELKAEMLMLYLLIFARMIAPAKQLVSALYTIQKGLPSARRIYAILEADEQIVEKEAPVDLTDFNKEISYQEVSFSYSETKEGEEVTVLDHINLTIAKGEKIAIVGPSGGGKSTLVDLLPRFYDVNSGMILIDGIDIKDYRIADLRKMFSIVNQDVTLFNTTVFQNIAFGLEGVTREEVKTAAQKAHADDFIRKMEAGYETIIGDRGLKLSGGERQRLSLARAILYDAPVLILDEATSALDNESEQIIRQALDELMTHKTAIIIAHRLSTIQHADRIIFIEKGKIIEQGSHAELLALGGEYAKYYCLQH